MNIKGGVPGFSSYICLFTAPSESVFEMNETMERIKKIPAEEPVPVFARIDHGKNAREAALEMPPFKVVIFGSSNIGST